jgi:hypothetical protein
MVVSDDELNAALAAVDGARPENETAAMLASQMALTHSLAMALLGRTRRAELLAQFDSAGSLAVKHNRFAVDERPVHSEAANRLGDP